MYSQEQLQKLRDAYAKGVLSVELAGEKVTFTSGAEMRRRIRDIESNLSGAAGGMTVSYATTRRGY